MATTEIGAFERSEPGSGPTPVYDDPLSDKAIKNGWRLDSPPAAFPQFQDPFLEPVIATLPAIPFESR